jgi:hypothetical protein
MFDESFFKQLSEICGHFATGFKKGKKLCDRMIVESCKEGTPKTETENVVVEGETTQCNPTTPTVRSILEDDFEESSTRYLKSSSFLISRGIPATLNKYFRNVLKENIRSDRFKNTWVHYDTTLEKTNKKAWKKISDTQLNKIYINLKIQFDEIKQELSASKPEYIEDYTWKKREFLLEYEFPQNIWSCKCLRKYLMNNHAELASLR